ncbi:uncharacterized protein A4U43_C07F650 [Asparagus officinalis]|uniref:Legume lectin domain-containing protein n=1 Tax=Asparagus officinalis TaxID=4686 RepID=A0A5P1EBG8_ASPOF|nr:L-type lectin-domain containing receptor kinase VIII.1-like [Asparagus officinalis]XP_020274167.1 L-type lectin-domain containing receptor kinase VIII.1-like [Asparagus officinalis]ONK62129.1 uncharacterized protein A4U43_C07F650 [Asparagus officinalis]
MAPFLLSGYAIFLLLCFSALSMGSVDEKLPFSLSFEKFENDQRFGSEIALYGDAEVRNSTVLMFGKGRMMCRKPFRFFGTNPGFSTYFSFSISAGYGQNLAFLLVPSNISQEAEVNPRFLVVKLAATNAAGASSIAFDVGGAIPVKSSSLVLSSEEKLHSWIDYDGASKMIEVKISKSRDLKPEKSLASCPVDLSNALWREAMYVGISSSGEGASRTSNVYSWSFNVTHGAPYQMHSEPLNPDSVTVRSYEDPLLPMRRGSPWKIVVALFVGVIFGALLASAVFFLRSKVVKRHPVSPIEYESEKIDSDGFKAVDVAGK